MSLSNKLNITEYSCSIQTCFGQFPLKFGFSRTNDFDLILIKQSNHFLAVLVLYLCKRADLFYNY